tara:strand:- start:875 stop:1030 length:156 start_codon:yes stop_codon:yes gene_type:complete
MGYFVIVGKNVGNSKFTFLWILGFTIYLLYNNILIYLLRRASRDAGFIFLE